MHEDLSPNHWRQSSYEVKQGYYDIYEFTDKNCSTTSTFSVYIISYITYILLKNDNTNSKHQHRVTELDGRGSERALTAVYRDKN